MTGLKFIEGEQKIVLSVRIEKSIYKALKNMAELQGKTISDITRQLLLNSIDTNNMDFVSGDVLLKNSTSIFVVPVGEENTIGTVDIYSAIRKAIRSRTKTNAGEK